MDPQNPHNPIIGREAIDTLMDKHRSDTPASLAPVGGPQHTPAVVALLAQPGDAWPFDCSNGMTVILQKPPRPTNILIAKALGSDSTNVMLYNYYKVATYIRRYGSIPINPPVRAEDFEMICNMIDDDTLDEIVLETRKHDHETKKANKTPREAGEELKNS